MPTPRLSRAVLGAGVALLLIAGLGAAPRHHRKPVRYNHVRLAHIYVNVTRPRPSAPPPKPRIPSAAELYERSLQADTRYSYRGRRITTYWKRGHAVAVIASHRAPALLRLDWVAPDAQRGESMVTTPTQEWHYLPAQRVLLHRTLSPGAVAVADAAESYDLLKTNYVLQVVPEKRIWADRKVFILTATRKSNRTPALKLWVDAATGLALKREYYREDGKLSVTVAFSDINFHPPLSPALFNLAALAKRPGVRLKEEKSDKETPIPLAAAGAQLGGKALARRNLAGYRLVGAALSGGGKPLLHLTYSDGLNPVSLFERPRTHVKSPTRVVGATQTFRIGDRIGHVTHRPSLTALVWDRGPLNLVLMGEIGERTLMKLAAVADGG